MEEAEKEKEEGKVYTKAKANQNITYTELTDSHYGVDLKAEVEVEQQ